MIFYKDNYWVFQDAILPEVCNEIISLAKDKGFSESLVAGGDHVGAIRNSSCAFINHQWLYDLFCPYVVTANKNTGWDFDIDWHEDIQIVRYFPNEQYKWHQDITPPKDLDSTHPNYRGKIRKLTAFVILSDSFSGGKFQFSFQDSGKINVHTPELTVGTIIIFPSFHWHRGTPVVKGTKYSMTLWSLGPPFK